MINKPNLMGTGDVCKLLGITQQSLHGLVTRGRIPCQRVSSSIIFFEEDVLEYKKQKEEKILRKEKEQLPANNSI